MSRPLVSVITIFLDAGRFIEEAIASVFAQSYEHWELLLVDDGSSDGSSEIARRWAERHPERVRYLEHPGHANRGRSAARNLGLAHARGELIAFLDGDDVFLPERLARHVALLARHPEVDMVQSRYEIWYSWQNDGPRLDSDHIGPSIEPYHQVLEPPLCLALMLAVPSIAPGTCNVTLRREVVQAAGGFDERFRGLYDDLVFYTKVYAHSRILVTPDVLARYRRHAQSCTRRDRGAMALAARLAFLNWLEDYLDGVELTEPGELQPLKRELAVERQAAGQPLRRLQHQLRALANDLLLAMLPARAYLALVRMRRVYEERSAARRVAAITAALPPRSFGEAQP